MKQHTTLQVMSASVIWHSAVKSAKRLVGLLVRASPLIVGSSSVSWVKAAFAFSTFVRKTIVHQGHRGLAIHLKTANVMLMRSVAGKGLDNSRLIGGAVARTRKGLPRLIPKGMRKRIQEGDAAVIRLYLGFFTLYRVLTYRGKLSLSSITNPGVPLTGGFIAEWREFCYTFFKMLLKFKVKAMRVDLVPVGFGSRASSVVTELHPNPMGIPVPKGVVQPGDAHGIPRDSLGNPGTGCRKEIWGYVPSFFPLTKSGPQSKRGRINSGNIIFDYFAWFQRPQLFVSYQVLVAITRSWKLFPPVISDCLKYLSSKWPILLSIDHGAFYLGALAVKVEPGKMRVFAMVDSLTQWLLYPLHRYIFDKVLRLIPQDGTFEQIAPVQRLIALKQADRDRRIWSFDLSAATDRIPVILQELLLGVLTTFEFAKHWRIILCNREYKIPPELVKQEGWPRRKDGSVMAPSIRYEVGQPMGAYSSWAMLALVHHAMVQWAAKKAGIRGWFKQYAVLGDDLVIGHYQVAHHYLSLCQTIGVDVNLSKSIISDNLSLEFAKRFFYKGEEVTPIPLLGLAVGWLGVRELGELAKEVLSRTGKRPSFYMMARFVNLGYKMCCKIAEKRIVTLSRKARSIVLLLTRPGSSHGVDSLLSWYSMTRANGPFLNLDNVWNRIADSTLERIRRFQAVRLRARLFKALVSFDLVQYWKRSRKEYSDPMAWFGVSTWWEENVIAPFKAPMLKKLDEIDADIARINAIIRDKDESSLLTLLQAMEDLEEQIALVPVKTAFERDIEDQIGLKSDKYPRRVRAWNRISKRFRRAAQDDHTK